jgi:phage terminase large subunit GpA-like protein
MQAVSGIVSMNYLDNNDSLWRNGLTPDPVLTVSEWADRHRILSSVAAAEPGQ